MYQQQNFQTQPSFVQSQYRGDISSQSRFQPTGYVQSFYQGTSSAPGASFGGSAYPTSTFQNQGFNQSQSGFGQGQFVGAESFHASNYRGNQQGHDNYLRADSVNPTSSFAGGYGQAGIGGTSGFQSTYPSSGMGQSQMSGYGGMQSPEAFHTANYRGNQMGHDNYLRADSTNPSSVGMTGGTSSYGSGSAFGTGTSYGAVTSQYQAQNPQSYHTANYVGNQSGHDNYLRADSTQPSQFGQYGYR